MVSSRKIILIIILLVTCSVTTYVIGVVIPTKLAERSYEGAKQIGRDIRAAFQFTPEITVNHTVVLQQETAVFELATVKQKFQHQYAWTSTWVGSTKKINISGMFESKAGFDLHKRFSITIEKDKAVVILPSPQLLSVELIGDVNFNDEQGIWNWVSAEDRSKAINAFQQDARKFALHTDLIQHAKINVEEKLTAILKLHGKKLEIRFRDERILKD